MLSLNKLCKFSFDSVVKRFYSSALYITGDKAHDTFAVLTPYIDFEERLNNRDELEKSIKLRGLNIDLDKVISRWDIYQTMNQQKILMERTKMEVSNQIGQLMKSDKKDNEKIEFMKNHSRLVKEELKVLKDYLYGIEENAALKVLSLPNLLHPKTPHDNELLVHSFLDVISQKTESHLDLGTTKNCIEYHNPLLYFLKSDAALFELEVCDYFTSYLNSNGYTQYSNADFVRSVVVEGCGYNFLDKTQVFTLENIHSAPSNECSRLHLVGGASLPAFMAYFTKHLIQTSYFPLRAFASGRKYVPPVNDTRSLFNVGQETALEVFIAVEDDETELENELEKIIMHATKLYEQLGYHFKMGYVPANKLKNFESLRLSLKMFSCHLQDYVEVGYISVYDNFISKRLLFSYSEDKQRKFPKVISGTLLSVPKLLGCSLEYNEISNKELKCNLPKSIFSGIT